ncbi:hypothetical protein TWF281_009990 [Arthrobotrys megalospora]
MQLLLILLAFVNALCSATLLRTCFFSFGEFHGEMFGYPYLKFSTVERQPRPPAPFRGTVPTQVWCFLEGVMVGIPNLTPPSGYVLVLSKNSYFRRSPFAQLPFLLLLYSIGP